MTRLNRLLVASGLVSVLALGWAILRPPTGLEARVLSTKSDQDFFKHWLRIQVNVELRPLPRSALVDWGRYRLVRSRDELPFLVLPKDLRLREVPFLVLDLERHVYGDELPVFATSRTLAELFEIALLVRRERARTAPKLLRWLEKRRLDHVEAWRGYTANWRPLGHTELKLEGLPLPAALNRLRKVLPQRFPDSEQQARLRRFLDAVQARPGDLDDLLVGELEEALPFAAFQVGAQRLARHLECFTQADLERFRSQRKTGHKDSKDLPVKEQPIWWMLDIPERARILEQARQVGDPIRVAAIELDAIKALQAAVARFPWSEEENNASLGAPALILRSKDLRCVGMSVLIHACLRSLGIAHDGLAMPRHVAILARTADGKEWVLDATGGPEPKAAKSCLPEDTPAQFLEYPNYVCRTHAERVLAAVILWNQIERLLEAGSLWNQTKEHTPEGTGRHHPWRRRFLAWYPDSLNTLDNLYRDQTRPGEAHSWLQRILKLTPNDPAAHLDRWALELDRGRTKQAQEAWEKAVKGLP